jgi:hypothetical protein
MELVNDVQYMQRAVIEFLVGEKELVGHIHKCLCNVYGSAAVDRSTIGQWVKRVTASETVIAELYDLLCSGCPVTAVCPLILQCADAIIHEDRCITC